MELKSVEPNDLVRRVQVGCSDSATELSNRFMPRLLILIERRLAGRRADAEDIAQESLAKAFQHLDRFDFNYQFSTWLFTIAYRLATDFARKENRQPKSFPIEIAEFDRSLHTSRRNHPSSEVVDDVWSLARSTLIESQYTVLWLKYGEGLSIQEIASVLNRTQIGVRVHLHRARSKLAKEISRMDCDRSNNRFNHFPPS